MVGCFFDVVSYEKFWELLEKGLDVYCVVLVDCFDVKFYYDFIGKIMNISYMFYGCWIENFGFFDFWFFNMLFCEVFQIDFMQCMVLIMVYEVFEMFGYVLNWMLIICFDCIGIFYGQIFDDWCELNVVQEVDIYYIMGGVCVFGFGCINYYFGFSGFSFNIDIVCLFSVVVMNVVCFFLWVWDCDIVIVGGLLCMINLDIFFGFSRG